MVAPAPEQQITHTQEDSSKEEDEVVGGGSRHGDAIILDMLKCCFHYFIFALPLFSSAVRRMQTEQCVVNLHRMLG